ncbi:L,D-transpeptidase family protein [Novosphingobium colocasiae]|nr:L,D-transpeptidase family protein [Novosphingobium colocasiae]
MTVSKRLKVGGMARTAALGMSAIPLGMVAMGLPASPAWAQAAGTDAAQPAPAATPAPAKPARRPIGDPIGDITRSGPAPAPSASATPAPVAAPGTVPPLPAAPPSVAPVGMAASAPVTPVEVPITEPVMAWTLDDARALLSTIEFIGKEGLLPADYKPAALRQAIAVGEGPALDELASRLCGWLIEDLRDGRTPVPARVQWFAIDPDRDAMPTDQIMAETLASHDFAGLPLRLAPTHPDYVALKEKLAQTPRANAAQIALIRTNMDRWRWLPQDLGKAYMFSNVPEFQVRLTVHNMTKGTWWNWTSATVVGKPGKTATPQLAETVKAVVFNPTWTVPQSIVVGEGLGAKVMGNPRWAAANGYKGTRSADGTITVVQQPGPNNALGMMKIDMPNPHAIYFHDTPAKEFFKAEVRAFSHGCVRTEKAVELGMLISMLGAGVKTEDARAMHQSGVYTKVPLTKTFPVYITYFTIAAPIDQTTGQFGPLAKFADIYGRDKPVIDSFAAPRQLKTTQRASDEAVIQLDNPL